MGKLIVIEGANGIGKTTLANNIINDKEIGNKIALFHEPGGTAVGEKIRDILLNDEMNKYTETLLFTASRCELYWKLKEELEKPDSIVLLDRYIYSTYVYQCLRKGVSSRYVADISDPFIIQPDLIIYLTTTVEAIHENQKKRGNIQNDKFEGLDDKGIEEELKYYDIALSIYSNKKNGLVIINNSDKTEKETYELAMESIKKCIGDD